MSALGGTQVTVLDTLVTFGPHEDLPTLRDVTDRVNGPTPGHYRTTSDSVRNALKRLARRGYVEQLDRSDGARCWAITEAGRLALRSEARS